MVSRVPLVPLGFFPFVPLGCFCLPACCRGLPDRGLTEGEQPAGLQQNIFVVCLCFGGGGVGKPALGLSFKKTASGFGPRGHSLFPDQSQAKHDMVEEFKRINIILFPCRAFPRMTLHALLFVPGILFPRSQILLPASFAGTARGNRIHLSVSVHRVALVSAFWDRSQPGQPLKRVLLSGGNRLFAVLLIHLIKPPHPTGVRINHMKAESCSCIHAKLQQKTKQSKGHGVPGFQ